MNICNEHLSNSPLSLKVKPFLGAVRRCAAGVQRTEIAGLCELLRPAQQQRRLEKLMVGPGLFPVLQDMQSGRTGGSLGLPRPPGHTGRLHGKEVMEGLGWGWWHGVCDRESSFTCHTTIWAVRIWCGSVGIYSRLWVGVRGHWEVAVWEKSNSTVHNTKRNNLKGNRDILGKDVMTVVWKHSVLASS